MKKLTIPLMFAASAIIVQPCYAKAIPCSFWFDNIEKSGVAQAAKDFFKESSEYWQEQLKFLSPSHQQSLLTRATKGTVFTVKHAAKISLAPTFAVVDIILATKRAIDRMHSGSTNAARLLFIPVDITQRNGLHVTAFTSLAIIATERMVTTDDIVAVQKPMPLRERELVVYIASPLDPNSQKFTQEMMKKNGHSLQNKNIIYLEPKTTQELFQSIANLRSKGQIREMHWNVHSGAPGYIDLQSEGLSNITSKKEKNNRGVIDEALLDRMKTRMKHWPTDVFAKEARISLYSCDLGKGSKGDRFLAKFGSLTLQEGGTIIAPTRTFYGGTKKENKAALKAIIPQHLTTDDLLLSAQNQLVMGMQIMFVEKFGIDALLEKLTDKNSSSGVKIYHTP